MHPPVLEIVITLHRFDMIYIVKDEHNESRDTTIARHVMKIHLNRGRKQVSIDYFVLHSLLTLYIINFILGP